MTKKKLEITGLNITFFTICKLNLSSQRVQDEFKGTPDLSVSLRLEIAFLESLGDSPAWFCIGDEDLFSKSCKRFVPI